MPPGNEQSVPYHDHHFPRGKKVYIKARSAHGKEALLELENVGEIGKGTFGKVSKMKMMDVHTKERAVVAVKHPVGYEGLDLVERDLLLALNHKNICNLLYYFHEANSKLVHLVLQLVEGGDLFQYLKKNYRRPDGIGSLMQSFGYQLLRGLAHCHSLNVVHRDIKPENLLVNHKTGVLKIADFGCGAKLVEHDGKKHTFYIGTRLFRAPELILGATNYLHTVDVWSAGIVMTEMVLGQPIFFHGNGLKGHMEKIFEYLGTPTPEEMEAMNVRQFRTPDYLQKKTYEERFKGITMDNKDSFLAMIRRILVYRPRERLTAWHACAHEFFDGLYDESLDWHGKMALPPLYDFTDNEAQSMPKEVAYKLIGRYK